MWWIGWIIRGWGFITSITTASEFSNIRLDVYTESSRWVTGKEVHIAHALYKTYLIIAGLDITEASGEILYGHAYLCRLWFDSTIST